MSEPDRSYWVRDIGRRVFWCEASVVMAAVSFRASQPRSGHRFEASWRRRWWGGYVLTLREWFPASSSE